MQSQRLKNALTDKWIGPDLTVAVGTIGLAVLGVENLHIHSVLKIHAFNKACIPVTEQWSLGRFIAGWDAAIQKEQSVAVPGSENPYFGCGR